MTYGLKVRRLTKVSKERTWLVKRRKISDKSTNSKILSLFAYIGENKSCKNKYITRVLRTSVKCIRAIERTGYDEISLVRANMELPLREIMRHCGRAAFKYTIEICY